MRQQLQRQHQHQITVVDAGNDPLSARILHLLLADEGYGVDSRQVGPGAVHALVTRPPELVIIVTQPDSSVARELVRTIRARGNRGPVLVSLAGTSAMPDPSAIAALVADVRADGCLPPPDDLTALFGQVCRLLRGCVEQWC